MVKVEVVQIAVFGELGQGMKTFSFKLIPVCEFPGEQIAQEVYIRRLVNLCLMYYNATLL